MKKTDLPQPYYLSVPEAAKLCGVSRNTLYTWVRKGKLSAYQTPGRTNLIRPSDLVDFMQNSGLFIPSTLQELAQRDDASNEPAATEKTPDASARRSVLVVDDDPLSRSFMVRALNDTYRMHQARTGFEALHLLTTNKDIRVVLLDLRMPGQHGLETLKEIKKLQPEAAVVIVTGYSGEMSEEETSHPNVARILVKPITIESLKETLREVEQGLVGGNGESAGATSDHQVG